MTQLANEITYGYGADETCSAPQITGSYGGAAGLAFLVACAYYAGTKLGLLLTPPGQAISLLWPPNAILLAALLLTAPRRWPILLLAVLPVHMFVQLRNGIPLTTALGWYFSNSSEALLGAACLHAVQVRRNIPARRLFETFDGIMFFVFFGALLA